MELELQAPSFMLVEALSPMVLQVPCHMLHLPMMRMPMIHLQEVPLPMEPTLLAHNITKSHQTIQDTIMSIQ